MRQLFVYDAAIEGIEDGVTAFSITRTKENEAEAAKWAVGNQGEDESIALFLGTCILCGPGPSARMTWPQAVEIAEGIFEVTKVRSKLRRQESMG